MPKKRSVLADSFRIPLGEDMFVSGDERSMLKGRRKAPRTEVCRPCLAWLEGQPEPKLQAVALDLNAYGMLLRTLHTFAAGARVTVQLMRDDDFQVALGAPVQFQVMRAEPVEGGFTDHGLKNLLAPIRKAGPRAEAVRPRRAPAPLGAQTRMNLADEIERRRTRR